MLQISEIIELIENELRKYRLPQQPSGLYDPVTYMLGIGGKRIRPALSLLASNIYTDDISAAINPALAMEVFHNFTLMHDDIMDHASLRRGMPSVHEKWNLNTAILSGDVMLVKAYELLCGIRDHNLHHALMIFNDTAAKVCEGQQEDIEFETKNEVTASEYISMITNKTAVLLGCSLYCGAVAGGASLQDANLLYDAGVNAGISFQIKDDELDCYGDEKTFGKKIGGDILLNKKTYLFVRTLELAEAGDREALINLYSLPAKDEGKKITAVMKLFEKYHAENEAGNAVKTYFDTAISIFKKINMAEERKQILSQFLQTIYGRKF